MNAFTFQSNEKYLNLKSKIKKNIQRKQRRMDLGGKKKRKKDHFLITISQKLCEEERQAKI